ncbi:Holliday junction branch migration protein RuvA [Caviibacter abscessus]|uniref:Holliday junction branch migration protein RuvA n=1 Tax=Caviibacter abscessus TaxID=1766719 RepID=UPI00082A2022|nr:Holliday junction branch migration protein RuvA [Caviibacter abscessus]
MYEYINGNLVVKELNYIALECMGVAYLIYIPFKTYEALGGIGTTEKIYIHMNVKEDDITLYGFKNINERKIFKQIIKVSGIGPKIALSVLSTFNYNEITNIINNEDAKLLSKVPGLGLKKAQKLIIELKDKVELLEFTGNSNLHIIKNEVSLALESLGYNKIKVEDYISNDEIEKLADSALIMKEILKKIAKKM